MLFYSAKTNRYNFEMLKTFFKTKFIGLCGSKIIMRIENFSFGESGGGVGGFKITLRIFKLYSFQIIFRI